MYLLNHAQVPMDSMAKYEAKHVVLRKETAMNILRFEEGVRNILIIN
jgi:hypothetical protein